MTFVIAEIGINHNGSLDLAKKLVLEAKNAGADAVKFQKRTVEIVYAGQLDKPRESPWGATLGGQKRGLEFGKIEYDAIDQFCRRLQIPWFASAWDAESLQFLEQYNLPYDKIASAMLTHKPFLHQVAQSPKPVLLSTGLSTDAQISEAIKILGPKKQIMLMHCVGTYPCDESDLNLSMIATLQSRYGLPVGYSGHEASVSPSVIAVALGAVSVERHITLDRAMYGSDQAASLEPHGFKTMVEQIRKLPIIMGDGVKRVIDGEQSVAQKLRYWES